MIDKLVIASMNKGKLLEIQTLLQPLGITVQSQADFDMPDTPETGTTFIENALIKARAMSDVTGLPVLADDSGLVVDALGGAPGVYSARYAGEPANDDNNIDKLLDALKDVPDEQRTAHLYCCMVLMRFPNDPAPIIATGEVPLTIMRERSGSCGFGYQPILFSPEINRCIAEISVEERNAISHRGKALREIIAAVAG